MHTCTHIHIHTIHTDTLTTHTHTNTHLPVWGNLTPPLTLCSLYDWPQAKMFERRQLKCECLKQPSVPSQGYSPHQRSRGPFLTGDSHYYSNQNAWKKQDGTRPASNPAIWVPWHRPHWVAQSVKGLGLCWELNLGGMYWSMRRHLSCGIGSELMHSSWPLGSEYRVFRFANAIWL